MNVQNETRNFFGVGAASWRVAGLILSESVYPPRLRMPRHQHDPAYFGIVLKGGYREKVGFGPGGRMREAEPLTTAFHPQDETHSVVFHDVETRIFRIEIEQSLRDRVEDYCPIPTEPTEFNGGAPASLALRLYSEFQRRDGWSRLSVEGLSLELLAELGRSIEQAGETKAPRWLVEIREILLAKFAENTQLADLAESVDVHPVHLAREFRKHFNSTIGDFVRRLRIETACREIAASDTPLSEIALTAGFYDQSHFSNAFKRFTGMTPAVYRASQRSQYRER